MLQRRARVSRLLSESFAGTAPGTSMAKYNPPGPYVFSFRLVGDPDVSIHETKVFVRKVSKG